MPEAETGAPKANAPPRGSDVDNALNQISLEQALVDFEIANARVIDLTRRLVEANEELAESKNSLELLRIQHADLSHRFDVLGRSRALRVAAAVRPLRQLLRR